MPGVGDQCRGLDLLADAELVSGDDAVRDYADQGTDHADTEMMGRPVIRQLADALDTGEQRARPDHNGDPQPGKVLGPVIAIRKRVRR